MKQNRSILHVEDDSDDVYFVERALRGSGIELPLAVATNGQAAIDMLLQARERFGEPGATVPCLVLLDLNLPHRSGMEVLKWIRQESPWRTLLVIVLTSSTSESDMHQAFLLGANSYIIKPSDATKLRSFGQLLKSYWLEWNQTPPLLR